MDQGSGFGTTVLKFPHDFPIDGASEKWKNPETLLAKSIQTQIMYLNIYFYFLISSLVQAFDKNGWCIYSENGLEIINTSSFAN